jgi:uncharacterized membrane protein YcaP (DUF421 family)
VLETNGQVSVHKRDRKRDGERDGERDGKAGAG